MTSNLWIVLFFVLEQIKMNCPTQNLNRFRSISILCLCLGLSLKFVFLLCKKLVDTRHIYACRGDKGSRACYFSFLSVVTHFYFCY